MDWLKKMMRNESGFALPMALILMVLGGLLIGSTTSLVSTSLNANRLVEERDMGLYAADAGIQYAVWKFVHDESFDPATEGLDFPAELNPVNEHDVSLNKIYIDELVYKVVSVATDPATGKSTTIEAHFQGDESQYEVGTSPFDYAVATLNGNLTMTGSATISSDCSPKPCNEGNVWVNGDTILGWSNVIEGDATMTGTCNRPGNIEGTYEPNGDPVERPTWLDDDVNDYIASTVVTAPGCSGTTYSSWDMNAGTYGAMQITGNMTINGSGTNYTFTGPVCVGGNLIISSGVNHVIFNGPVKVNGYVDLGGNGTVIFQDVLYIGKYIKCAGSRSAQFEGQVAVNGSSRLSNQYIVYFDGSKYSGVAWDVIFNSTLRATETPNTSTCYKVRFGSGRSYTFYDAVYTTESVELAGNTGCDMTFTKALIADCNIVTSGSSEIDAPPTTSPLFVSRYGNVTIGGDVRVDAIVYAPEGSVTVSGSSQLEGAVVAESALLEGNIRLKYPVILRERDDLHEEGGGGGGGGGGESPYSLINYSIQ